MQTVTEGGMRRESERRLEKRKVMKGRELRCNGRGRET